MRRVPRRDWDYSFDTFRDRRPVTNCGFGVCLMKSGFNRYLPAIAVIFWVCAIITAVIWFFIPSAASGWDLHVYANAIHSLRIGHDPYLDGIAVQRAFHAHLAEHPNAAPPFSYVYSPITLPLLRWLGSFSLQWVAGAY